MSRACGTQAVVRVENPLWRKMSRMCETAQNPGKKKRNAAPTASQIPGYAHSEIRAAVIAFRMAGGKSPPLGFFFVL